MSRAGVLLDTGPLVALLHRGDVNHARAKALFAGCEAPLRTCEAVLAEAAHLLSKVDARGPAGVLALGIGGVFRIALHADEHWMPLQRTLEKYRNIPASFADACLIRAAELHDERRILTFDSGFEIYRWGRNRAFEIMG